VKYHYRALVIGLGLVVVAASVTFKLLPEPINWEFARWATMLSYGAAMAGSWYGANGFGRHDRLRWAWQLTGSYAVIGLCKIILWGSPRHVGPAMGFFPELQTGLTNGISTTLLNVFSVAGLVLFARVWHGTGLSPPWRKHITLVAFALGLAMGGLPVWRDIQQIMAGNTLRIGGLASSLGDIASITLMGPVMVTAIAMRGGVLVWPWSILTASAIAWLLFDAVQLLPGSLVPMSDLGTIMAATLTTGAAGVAHRWAVEETALPPL
jgi:hypothetical protein